jgi:hypothetical protein
VNSIGAEQAGACDCAAGSIATNVSTKATVPAMATPKAWPRAWSISSFRRSSFQWQAVICFFREGRLVAIESFYFYIIFLHTTLDNEIYSRLRADFPEWFGRLTSDNAPFRLKPVRDYLALKQDEYRVNAPAYFEWRERYLKRQNDLSSEWVPSADLCAGSIRPATRGRA